MKVISTLNFKGGVGKTTVSWLLARYLVEMKNKKVLVIDADPQMSLTTAVQLLESGLWDTRFNEWYKEVKRKEATLYCLLERYGHSASVTCKQSPFYEHRPNLYLLPSDEALYWYDLEAARAKDLQAFMGAFLRFVESQTKLPKFDYCFADCPPAFNSLSFSIVCHSDLVLIPINPDVFASRGVRIMLDGLKHRLENPPPFLVFMNRAKSRTDRLTGQPILTRESSNFLNNDVAPVVDAEREAGVTIVLLRDVYIPERKGIKDALASRGRRIPPDLENYFAELWDEIENRFMQPVSSIKTESLSPDRLRDDYAELIKAFGDRGRSAVEQFIGDHSSTYLDAFIKANSLPIATKASKQDVLDGLVSCLAERKVIQG